MLDPEDRMNVPAAVAFFKALALLATLPLATVRRHIGLERVSGKA